MPLDRLAVKLDFALPDILREDEPCSPESEPIMGAKIVSLPEPDVERIGSMTAGMACGDETAFQEFHDRYCDRLFRFLLVLTRGNEDLARDLVQATMIKVVRGPHEFQDEARFWNWLAMVARNGFIDFLRRNQRAPQLVPLLPDDAPEILLTAIGESDMPLFDALDCCLGDLGADERALIEAFYFKGGSHQSMAEQRQITPKAIESKLARLRHKLRSAILKRLQYEND